MSRTEIEPVLDPPAGPDGVEDESGSSLTRLALLVGLVVLLGVWGSFSAVVIALALVVMIFLHELGHYLMAKAAGMKVTEFFIGFGPRIWSFRRGETEYGIKAVPAGAYVKIIGMSNLEEVDPADEERTYRAKPFWRRLSVAVAGSTMHFIIAFVLICVVFMGFGVQDASSNQWALRAVSGPALDAGLKPGDRIVTVDGHRYADFDAMSAAVRSMPGEKVDIVVRRGGTERTFTATLGKRNPTTDAKVGFLGVSPSYDFVRTGPVTGAVDGVKEMGTVAKTSIVGLGRLFSPSGISNYVESVTDARHPVAGAPADPNRVTSVVGIVQVGSQAAQDGIVNVIYLMFVVNMFIGIFNLTPLLPFDGGHVVIAVYEKIRSMIRGQRYRADVAKLLPLTYAVVLVLAFVFVTSIYLDIANPMSIR